MNSTLRTRKGTISDIPFLANIEYEASLPPLNYCFWEGLLQGTGTNPLQFIEAMLRADAGNWGDVADFLIIEDQGKPMAAPAGYTPNSEDYCPLRLSKLGKIAQGLNWSEEIATTWGDRYVQFWGGNLQPSFLTPQATWIIESVAVLPEARGRGLGKLLIKTLLEEGRSKQHSYAGIMIIHGNEAARHTYESLGFKPYQTFYADYFLDQCNFGVEFPGVTKYRLRLD